MLGDLSPQLAHAMGSMQSSRADSQTQPQPSKSKFYGVTPGDTRYMLLAARLGDTQRLRKSLFEVNPLHARDMSDSTPLHHAAARGYVDACNILLSTEPKLVRAINQRRDTALHSAANAGQLATATLLIFAGADLNARGADGFTPLHLASSSGHLEVLQYLLECGADPDLVSRSGLSARDLAFDDKVRAALPEAPLAATRAAYEERFQDMLRDVFGSGAHDEVGDLSRFPAPLTCPITHAPLVDPVRTADGHVYERFAITQWLEEHESSPLTGLVLANKRLHPDPRTRESVANELANYASASRSA